MNALTVGFMVLAVIVSAIAIVMILRKDDPAKRRIKEFKEKIRNMERGEEAIEMVNKGGGR